MEYSNTIQDSELKLCSGCQQFYGKKETNYMCSQCFKEISNTNKVNAEKSPVKMMDSLPSEIIEAKTLVNSQKIEAPKVNEVAPVAKVEDAKMEAAGTPETAQKDVNMEIAAPPAPKKKNRCHFCNKKMGMLSIQCKCGFSF